MGESSPSQTLYFGTFERSLDAKKRVAVPSQWLISDRSEDFYIIPHPSGEFLIVMPPSEFSQMEERLSSSNLPPDKKRKAIRQFYAAARQVCTDKQGRVLVSEDHCERVGLNGEAVFVGGRSRFEIWNKSRYAQMAAEDSGAYQEVADSIGL